MAKNTIKIKKYLDVIEERVAAAAISPGMLLQINSTGKVQAHSTESGNVFPCMFALEDELQGKGIEDDYATNDQVQCWIAQRGEYVYALLADGESVAIGDLLSSKGTGYLKKHDLDSLAMQEIVAIAMEAIDRSSSSGADTNKTGRIIVMVV